MKECIFCDIASKKIGSKIIFENNDFISFFDISPEVLGHCLIIPKEHFENLFIFDSDLGKSFFDCLNKTLEILKKDFSFQGFNLVVNNGVVSGQEVLHLHFHILPRRKNDGLYLSLKK